ncbi:hypothetical protein ATCC90586_005013 [Pythium insidiosum]|nr:hypothetical protein ATCC90586_005013 [Pythium insidiosum]
MKVSSLAVLAIGFVAVALSAIDAAASGSLQGSHAGSAAKAPEAGHDHGYAHDHGYPSEAKGPKSSAVPTPQPTSSSSSIHTAALVSAATVAAGAWLL